MAMSLDQPVMVAALAPAAEPVTDPLDPQVPTAVPKPAEVQAAELTPSALLVQLVEDLVIAVSD